MTNTPPEPSSQYTTTLPIVLQALASTLMVTTYQAGKLFAVRALGSELNTHFRGFDTPMGLAWDGKRLAVGTRTGLWEFRNHAGAVSKLPAALPHDACFLPRSYHHTSHIAGHELGWAESELWIVNTRFSCLCTIDSEVSFRPRWQPPFISQLLPEDRCHLNGLAMRDGQPRYVSALGISDTAAGWRANKANGGILMDVPTGEILARGLSMPHSPRWHEGELWFLESGVGSLAKLNIATGQVETVALLPGFTRGLDFAGPFAFVGLSQVRDSNQFSGLPITERLRPEERACGVWVVDLRTRESVAFLQFTQGVQEIFAVQLVQMRFPELLNDPLDDLLANSFVLAE
jgi:uncharacterized protein (TIGR03032 family)